MTLGYGGHTQEMLKCLQGEGHMYALDVDAVESARTRRRLADLGYGEEILTIRHLSFADIDQVASEADLLTLCWRIWEYPPCRLIIRTEVSLINRKVRWI